MILKKLNHKKKNLLMWLGMLSLIYIAYTFSFGKTIDSLRLNNQLKNEKQTVDGLDSTLPQTLRKKSFYEEATKSYWVKKDDRETRLWQVLSGIAVLKKVSISFGNDFKTEADTAEVKYHIFRQKFMLKGSYFDLISVLDSIHRTSGIGRISSLKFLVKKENEFEKRSKKLILQLEFSGIEH